VHRSRRWLGLGMGLGMVVSGVILSLASPLSSGAIAPGKVSFPTFSTAQIDRQLTLYLRYVAEQGRPDILIVGSSRSLQGIDPAVLQQSLGQAGYRNLKIFNFGINGATAQVVKLLLEDLLTPAQMPQVILWGDGSRAFNSGRIDRTYAKITASPGYQKLQSGHSHPQLLPDASLPQAARSDRRVLMGLNVLTEVFAPKEYFTKFSRVPGRYDGDYRQFSLEGVQTEALVDVLQTARRRQVPVVFVNLPLTDLYIDRTRSNYEREFRRYNQRFADRGELTFFDLGQKFADRYEYFTDPSHLNQAGAQAVAQELGGQMATYFERRLKIAKRAG
jgi:hypothetical protein